MVAYTNFYETVAEANIRLKGTIVLYDSQPYVVLAISNHRGDGIFRIYLDPLTSPESLIFSRRVSIPPLGNYPQDHPELGVALDKWIVDWSASNGSPPPVLRKQMNSPLFNKFRPFPLGMCNYHEQVYYFERHPNRRTEQGLTTGNLQINSVGFERARVPMSFYGGEFLRCIQGDYPSLADCLSALDQKTCKNEGLAFHRLFAVLKGPADTRFLAHKTDTVGFLPDNDTSRLLLADKYRFLKEAILELNLFSSVSIR